jgi:regulator of RNase E activity RraA
LHDVIDGALDFSWNGTESRQRHNWLLIDALTTGDVMVADIFDKIDGGTVVGDRLGTAVAARTGAGAVIGGSVRDLDGLRALAPANFFFRAAHPTAIRDVTLAGLNIPVRIGAATVLPGDVVLGTLTGVIFIPPHLAQAVAEFANETRLRDQFSKVRLSAGKYSAGEIDVKDWMPHIQSDYDAWRVGQV